MKMLAKHEVCAVKMLATHEVCVDTRGLCCENADDNDKHVLSTNPEKRTDLQLHLHKEEWIKSKIFNPFSISTNLILPRLFFFLMQC